MKFAGIIAEYDPFHNGHAWQLAQAKALGAERVAVAMSCSLVQRGALPLLPEAVRTRSALICGLTLCLLCLLPVPARGQRRSPGRAWRCLPPPGATVWCSAPRRPTRPF